MSHSTFLGKGLYRAMHLSEKGRTDRFVYEFLGQIVDFDPASGTAWTIGRDRLLRHFEIRSGLHHVYPLAVGPQIRPDGYYSPDDVQALLGPPPLPEPVGMPIPSGGMATPRHLEPQRMLDTLVAIQRCLKARGLLGQLDWVLQDRLKDYR